MRTSPLRKLTEADLDVLVERVGRGESQRAVAAELEVAQSSVSRLLRRPEVAARVRVVRKREAARLRQQRKRDRELLARRTRDAAAPAQRFGHQTELVATLPGVEYPRLERQSPAHRWRYNPQVGFSRWATRADCLRFGVDPAALEPEYGFGDPRGGYDRPPVGHIPHDRQHVRVTYPPNERGIRITSPVERRYLDQALAEGAGLAV